MYKIFCNTEGYEIAMCENDLNDTYVTCSELIMSVLTRGRVFLLKLLCTYLTYFSIVITRGLVFLIKN